MVYPSDFETRLGFDRIRAFIEAKVKTSPAAEKVSQMSFVSDFNTVEHLLQLSKQMCDVLTNEDGFPTSGYVETNTFLRRVRAEGTWLDAEELHTLRRGLITIQEVVRFLRSKEDYPALRELTVGVETFDDIVKEINTILNDKATVKDNASPELFSIRSAILEREGQVRSRMQSILRAAQAAGIVEDGVLPAIRDGRTVIPVPAGNKRKIKGFVHDESATGRTAYIEPIEIVELDNEIKELEYGERREIIKILVTATAVIRPNIDSLLLSADFLAEVEFIKAKALVALEMNAVKPILSKEPILELRSARHPLLERALKKEGKPIVPLDIKLTAEKHILVISGPNAGGKSVCLKSVGLLQYMVQCGLLIPVLENSEVGLFDSIFADIGDQQSLDNDLSTYSSHLTNMKTMLRESTAQSLVLIDEFGSGTEPAIGGAIAEAILERIEKNRVFGIITTHYTNLKYYADKAGGVIGGAMSFDVQNLRPLFRLEMGKPGSSYAFEIAGKIGLPHDVISAAKEKIDSGQINIERQLREIASDKRYWERKRDKIRLAEKRSEELAEKYEKELTQIKQQRDKLIHDAKAEANNVIAEANKVIERTIREIKESAAEKERTKNARVELENFKKEQQENIKSETDLKIERKMQQIMERQQRREQNKSEGDATVKTATSAAVKAERTTPEVGDKVRIKGQSAAGEVLSINGKMSAIAFGGIKAEVETKRLEIISNSEYKRFTKELSSSSSYGGSDYGVMPGGTSLSRKGYDVGGKRLNFSPRIDLRGERVDAAIQKVQEFVDEAMMLGIHEVKILHGKGTGALKEEIRRYLTTMYPVQCSDETEDLGGAGITVVRF